MRKTFDEIIEDEFNSEENYSLTSGDLEYISEWAKKLMKLVREKTIEECIEKGYGLYFEDEFDYNPSIVNINKESLEKLDKESIKE